MNKLLSACGRRAMVQLAICTAMVLLWLYIGGRIDLFPAFIGGYLLAATCFWVLIYRTWKSSRQNSVAKAKQQMQLGLVLRLFTVFVVLWTAIHISLEVFWSVVGGFFMLTILLMVNIIAFACSGSVGKK